MDMKADRPWLKARMIIEILGTPENYVNETLALIGEKFGQGLEEIKVTDIKVKEAQKVQAKNSENFYSGFLEIDASFADLYVLFGVIFDYLPSSVEIYEPQEFTDSIGSVMDVINDLIARLHQYDSALKTEKARNMLLARELMKFKEAKPAKV